MTEQEQEQEQAGRFTVGYALAPKKVSSFIQPSLLEHAKNRCIDLVPINPDTPLIQQGPFDCIIHKINGEDWKKQLEDFSIKNPNAAIIDPPEAIERLHSRISMLDVVKELKIHEQGTTESLGIPKQVVIYEQESLDYNVLDDLCFPVIAKPLMADGSPNCHTMSVVLNGEGLKKVNYPIVLQEFVNHGGVVFKVYVVGDHVSCVKRRSLPDFSPEMMWASSNGLLTFSQISNHGEENKNGHGNTMNHAVEAAEMPPLSFINEIAIGLRKAMKLNLFNFDVIRDAKVGDRYIVIDINYFPGYEKMPFYEAVLTGFFRDVLDRKSLSMKEHRDRDDNAIKL